MGLSDYRPIKILAKILTARLKKVVPNLAGKIQSDFMGSRNIQDGVLIANEIVVEWKRRKKKGIIIKLDFEKAYDSLNWIYLFGMLKRFGFPPLWIRWMEECVTT